MKKIEHIGIAVKSIEESNLLFEKLLGAPAYKQEEVASEGVKTAFFSKKKVKASITSLLM
jgi:methylmalonyl-CoA/ethylmalonyl-CoA epimerase